MQDSNCEGKESRFMKRFYNDSEKNALDAVLVASINSTIGCVLIITYVALHNHIKQIVVQPTLVHFVQNNLWMSLGLSSTSLVNLSSVTFFLG